MDVTSMMTGITLTMMKVATDFDGAWPITFTSLHDKMASRVMTKAYDTN